MKYIKTKKGNVALPVMNPIIVPIHKLEPNKYNPNKVAINNMELLERSILDNGFCFAVVTIYDKARDKYIIIDGFHRYEIFKKYFKAKEIPIIVLEHNIEKRMAASNKPDEFVDKMLKKAFPNHKFTQDRKSVV